MLLITPRPNGRAPKLVDFVLSRARTAALGGAARSRTVLAPAVADHAAVFAKFYVDKAIRFDVNIDPAIAVACEAQDVDEVLGNFLDNAELYGGSLAMGLSNLGGLMVTLNLPES